MGPRTEDNQPLPLLLTSGDHHWKNFQTCSFQDQLPPPPHLVLRPSGVMATTETHMVDNRAVRILLEFFLVCHKMMCLEVNK